MIQPEQIAEILAQYQRHGWTLRRVLLSDSLRVHITSELPALFSGAEIVSSGVDAVWFSRPTKNGEAWELRHLSETPFALFELFDDKTNAADLRARLVEMENRLKSRVLISR